MACSHSAALSDSARQRLHRHGRGSTAAERNAGIADKWRAYFTARRHTAGLPGASSSPHASLHTCGVARRCRSWRHPRHGGRARDWAAPGWGARHGGQGQAPHLGLELVCLRRGQGAAAALRTGVAQGTAAGERARVGQWLPPARPPVSSTYNLLPAESSSAQAQAGGWWCTCQGVQPKEMVRSAMVSLARSWPTSACRVSRNELRLASECLSNIEHLWLSIQQQESHKFKDGSSRPHAAQHEFPHCQSIPP